MHIMQMKAIKKEERKKYETEKKAQWQTRSQPYQ